MCHIGVAGVCMLRLSHPVRRHGIALSNLHVSRPPYFLSSPFLSCSLLVVTQICSLPLHRSFATTELVPLERMKHHHGHWACWMSTSSKNGLMWITHTKDKRGGSRITWSSTSLYNIHVYTIYIHHIGRKYNNYEVFDIDIIYQTSAIFPASVVLRWYSSSTGLCQGISIPLTQAMNREPIVISRTRFASCRRRHVLKASVRWATYW